MREENIWHTLRRAKSVSRANLFWRKFHFTNRIDSYAFHFIFSLLTFRLSSPLDFPAFFFLGVHHWLWLSVYWARSADGNANDFGGQYFIVRPADRMKHARTCPGVNSNGVRWPVDTGRPIQMLMKSAWHL